jgi:hypothetical protein
MCRKRFCRVASIRRHCVGLKLFLTELLWGEKSVALDQPCAVVRLLELEQRPPEVLGGVRGPNPEQVHRFARECPALRDALALPEYRASSTRLARNPTTFLNRAATVGRVAFREASIPAATLYDPVTKTFANPADAEREFGARGVTKEKQVIAYCEGGISATIDLQPLRRHCQGK